MPQNYITLARKTINMKKIYFSYILVIVSNLPIFAYAGGFQTLYDQRMLMDWKSKVEYALPYNLNEKIIGELRGEEPKMVQRVQLVLNKTEQWNEPFSCYVKYSLEPNGSISHIHISLTTLRFWQDICLAHAWLVTNNYSLETIGAYMSMMKYRVTEDGDNPKGQYTPPLEALKIPSNAFDSPGVTDLYDKLFNSSIMFIMAHEIGHIRYRHKHAERRKTETKAQYQKRKYEKSRKDETEADEFALELMRRIKMPPMGMLYFFSTYAHFVKTRSDFRNEKEYYEYLMNQTHPLEGNRIIALGEGMKLRAKDFAQIQDNPTLFLKVFEDIGSKIIEIGKNLNSPSIQIAMTLQGKSTKLQALAPRSSEQSAVKAYGVPSQNPNYVFNGIYSGNITDKSGSAEVNLVLFQNDKSVRGIFTQGIGVAYIDGCVKGDLFEFDWEWYNYKGKGIFKNTNKGERLTGKWGTNGSKTNRGKWNISRK